MELWIFLSIAAAFFQTLRFMLQKQLSQTKLTATGATLARFLYSAPLVVVLAAIYLQVNDRSFAMPSVTFWFYGALGGAAQVLATICTVKTFAYRNFAVGVTFKKTEVLQTALIGLILFGEAVTGMGVIAMVIGFAGVIVLSGAIGKDTNWRASLTSPATLLGLSAGALFGISATTYRAASLMIETPDPFERAFITLAAVTSMQLIGMLIYLLWRDRAEIGRVMSVWRTAGFVGLTSIAGSYCWFTAFTLQNAAYVKAVGQIELIFSIIATTLVFKEKITLREFIGIGFISLSVLGLMVWV